MHPRAEEFSERAREEYGFEVDVHEFPEGTKTAADAAEAIGCDVAEIASSIVFEVDGDPVVVVTSGANRVSEEKLADAMDAPEDAVSIADADSIREALGWSIGGVPPFCHDTQAPVLLDETLTAFETVWAAAGTPEAVFPISPAEIREFADARPADVAE
jgi:prolyl-tRNA editing enzyme YbaK/EbsC (Cys-tRNA(Pro) deacylase)